MDTIRLEPLERGRVNRCRINFRILINSKNFIDMVRDVELPFAKAEGFPEIAGNYIGFDDWILDRFMWAFTHGGEVPLLSCGDCGDNGCWSLVSKISAASETFTWSNFYNPHRHPDSPDSGWNHRLLGPFIFAKDQYTREFEGAYQHCREEKSSRKSDDEFKKQVMKFINES